MRVHLPTSVTVRGKRVFYGERFKKEYDLIIARSDVLDFLADLPSGTADLIVTSPPYNLGKIYEKKASLEHYLNWQEEVIKRCVEILSPHGSICWQVGNYVERGEVFPLDILFYPILEGCELKLRNRIIWHYGHGLHAEKRFSGRYETIMWFTKGDEYTFNLDSVRVRQKYPGKRSFRGPNKGKPSGHPLGNNPSDIWEIVQNDWDTQIWDVPNVKFNHIEKTIHPCQFPVELVERLVLALTDEGDTILDPFVGVGSSLIAAALHNRKGIGVDKEKTYTDIAYDRVLQALKGSLRTRPLGRPIFQPRGTEKVANLPPEWKKRHYARRQSG